MNTVGAYAQSPGTLPKWARAKIHVVLGMQIEFVRPSLQRFEHFQQTAKAKNLADIRPGPSHHFMTGFPAKGLDRHHIVDGARELDSIYHIFTRNVAVMQNHDDHTLKGLVEALNNAILWVYVRGSKELNNARIECRACKKLSHILAGTVAPKNKRRTMLRKPVRNVQVPKRVREGIACRAQGRALDQRMRRCIIHKRMCMKLLLLTSAFDSKLEPIH